MTSPALPARGITDEDLGDQAAFVRGLVVQRLEQIWSTCAPHIDGRAAEEGLRVDVRFVEAGIRVLDRLAKLYRLDDPVRGEDQGKTQVIDPAVLVSKGLLELEQRVREREQADRAH